MKTTKLNKVCLTSVAPFLLIGLASTPALAQLGEEDLAEPTAETPDSSEESAPEESAEESTSDASSDEPETPEEPVEEPAPANEEPEIESNAEPEEAAPTKAKKKGVPARAHPDLPERRFNERGSLENRRFGNQSSLEGDRVYEGLYSSTDWLGWDGNAQIDVGYAKYGFDLDTFNDEDFYDFRGRFVFGPVVHHDFGDDYFFRGKGEVVTWVREEFNKYQVNADEVFFQIGKTNTFDVQLGRFQMWQVYHRGNGFEIFTLEDTGALKQPPYESFLFGVDIYELNGILWRETPGHGAVHYYPTDWLGFELGGVYGKELLDNTYGGRLAADMDTEWLRVSAAGEYRTARPAELTGCANCGKRTMMGAGGSAVLKLKYADLGGSFGYRTTDRFDRKEDMPDAPGTADVMSVGGFAELDPGKFFFGRSFIIGAGLHSTSRGALNGDFERHTQGAAYAIYPLGFNDAAIKLVLSKADLYVEEDLGGEMDAWTYNSDMLAGRLRVSYFF